MSCKKAAAVLPAFGSVTPELPVLGHLGPAHEPRLETAVPGVRHRIAQGHDAHQVAVMRDRKRLENIVVGLGRRSEETASQHRIRARGALHTLQP